VNDGVMKVETVFVLSWVDYGVDTEGSTKYRDA
jgi:hypothetical protein